MSEFWDELFDDTDVDEEEDEDESEGIDIREELRALLGDSKTGLLKLLELMAQAKPEYSEGKEYLRGGLEYILKNYMDDDEEVNTHRGTSHCTIVNAVMLDTTDDEEVADLFKAIESGEELQIMEAIRSLMHHSVHLGMAVAMGMLVDEGKLED